MNEISLFLKSLLDAEALKLKKSKNKSFGYFFEDYITNSFSDWFDAEIITDSQSYNFISKYEGVEVENQVEIFSYFSSNENDRFILSQPYGSQKKPDLMFLFNYQLLMVECKSSKGKRPTMNSSIPPENILYIVLYNRKRGGNYRFFFGEDICNPQSYKKVRKDLNLLQEEFKERGNDIFREHMPTYLANSSNFYPRMKLPDPDMEVYHDIEIKTFKKLQKYEI